MSQQERVHKLIETMRKCLAELDLLEAHVAAAHLDSAIHALRQQEDLVLKVSETE